MIRQIFKISLMNLRNLPSRFGISSVVVVGIGGVVGVLVAILAMASGFESALSSGASSDRVILLREGSTDEMSSSIGQADVALIETLPGVAALSPELYTVVDIPKMDTGTYANLIARGVGTGAFEVRPEIEIVAGRNFEPGRTEIIAGVKAATEFRGLDVGAEVPLRDSMWQVVGHFEAAGSAYESEIWLDFPAALNAFRRNSATSLRVRLDSPASFEELKQAIEADPRLQVQVLSELSFMERQSATLRQTIKSFGYAVAVIIATQYDVYRRIHTNHRNRDASSNWLLKRANSGIGDDRSLDSRDSWRRVRRIVFLHHLQWVHRRDIESGCFFTSGVRLQCFNRDRVSRYDMGGRDRLLRWLAACHQRRVYSDHNRTARRIARHIHSNFVA